MDSCCCCRYSTIVSGLVLVRVNDVYQTLLPCLPYLLQTTLPNQRHRIRQTIDHPPISYSFIAQSTVVCMSDDLPFAEFEPSNLPLSPSAPYHAAEVIRTNCQVT